MQPPQDPTTGQHPPNYQPYPGQTPPNYPQTGYPPQMPPNYPPKKKGKGWLIALVLPRTDKPPLFPSPSAREPSRELAGDL